MDRKTLEKYTQLYRPIDFLEQLSDALGETCELSNPEIDEGPEDALIYSEVRVNGRILGNYDIHVSERLGILAAYYDGEFPFFSLDGNIRFNNVHLSYARPDEVNGPIRENDVLDITFPGFR